MHLVAVYLAAVYTASEGINSVQIALVAFSIYHLAPLMSIFVHSWRSLLTAFIQLALVAVYLNVN